MELERPGGPGIGLFRDSGGPGLLVPESHRGRGASTLDALRVQRAIGSRSPSLAVATTMHHFSMATLVGLGGLGEGLEWMLIEGVAAGNRILASGFAEGRSGAGVLEPSMTATVTGDAIRINGVKRPCSLARSMDVLTASVLIPREDGQGEELAVALVPADSEGISVTGFWSSSFLAGAESEQVTLTDVLVPQDLVLRTHSAAGESLDELQTAAHLVPGPDDRQLSRRGQRPGERGAAQRPHPQGRTGPAVPGDRVGHGHRRGRRPPRRRRGTRRGRPLPGPVRPLRRPGRPRPDRPPRGRTARRPELHGLRRDRPPRRLRPRPLPAPAVPLPHDRPVLRVPGRPSAGHRRRPRPPPPRPAPRSPGPTPAETTAREPPIRSPPCR
ncbi:hypothetical protein SFUMM280S_01035 [Streptomyces fumanus]